MTITVERLSSEMLSSWDSYVEQSGSATFFHLAGWKEVLERAFGYKTHFLFARKNGVIVGVLPLAQVNSVLFGSSLASLPFCVYGGIVSDHEDVVQALRREACNLADAVAPSLTLCSRGLMRQPLHPTTFATEVWARRAWSVGESPQGALHEDGERRPNAA